MSKLEVSVVQAVVVETDVQFSLADLSRVCGADAALLELLVHEGVLTARGDGPTHWRFEGAVLPRARTAIRLVQDLELGAPGAALVLDLFDEIQTLKAALRRQGG